MVSNLLSQKHEQETLNAQLKLKALLQAKAKAAVKQEVATTLPSCTLQPSFSSSSSSFKTKNSDSSNEKMLVTMSLLALKCILRKNATHTTALLSSPISKHERKAQLQSNVERFKILLTKYKDMRVKKRTHPLVSNALTPGLDKPQVTEKHDCDEEEDMATSNMDCLNSIAQCAAEYLENEIAALLLAQNAPPP